MLTTDQSIVTFDRGVARPDRLSRKAHAHYLDYASRMLTLYRSGVGRIRRDLHRAVESILADEPDCSTRRVAAFCRILDDAADFERDPRGQAAKLRLRVFTAAARFHPLVTEADKIFERTEAEVKRVIAAELGQAWEQIDAALYADVIDQQRLASFPADFTDGADLLSRYNVAQLQACLYRATKLEMTVTRDVAAVVRRAKLCGLLLEIRRSGIDEYCIDLSGPTTVLRESRRYGVKFAHFVPTLLACRGWRLRATVITPWKALAELSVSSEDGYRSHLDAPPEYDSEVERKLAGEWGAGPRNGWSLFRQAGVLHERQATFVPDFLLRNNDGREVFLEVVGFWTAGYLAAKRKTVAQFAAGRMILAVPAGVAKPVDSPILVLFKKRIDPEHVVAAAEAICPPRVML